MNKFDWSQTHDYQSDMLKKTQTAKAKQIDPLPSMSINTSFAGHPKKVPSIVLSEATKKTKSKSTLSSFVIDRTSSRSIKKGQKSGH